MIKLQNTTYEFSNFFISSYLFSEPIDIGVA